MYICQLLLVCTWFYSALLCLSTVVAQDSSASCQFPFIYKDVRYTECTTKDDPDGKLWCSTKTDNQDRHILKMGHYKHCTVTTRIEEKSECKTYPDGKVGDCMSIQKCPSLNAIVQRVSSGTGNSNEFDIIRKSVCQHDGKDLGVCCTRTPTKTITRPATSNPLPRPPTSNPTPSPAITDPTGKMCGTNYIPDRIVGGHNAKLTAWPWMVIFRANEKTSCSDNNPSCSGWASSGECENNPSFMNANCKKSCNKCPSNWICGGVLITDQYVLSAAHCFKDNIQVEYARIGEFDLSINPDTGGGHTAPKPQDIDIERIIKQEEYNTPKCRRCNVIALVKLAKPAQIHTFFVEPVCLPSNPQRDIGFSVSEFQNKLGWATGWGVSKVEDLFTIKHAQRLQQVNLTIQELDFCRQRKPSYPDGRMILCAGQGDGNDTCRGDSGGPIMLSDNVGQKWYIIGITSFGATVCGSSGAQGIFTSVHYYMDWIYRNIA